MKEIQILNNGDTLYDIRTKINENFELVAKEADAEPLVSFGVNEGNETNGVADLIEINDNTLNFKVGGEYPNLVITSGDGVTTRIENVNPLYLQNLADGEYTVLVNESNSTITDAEFYSQLLEPENPNNGDVWFNGQDAKEFKSDALTAEKTETKSSGNFQWVAQVGDSYVASSGPRSFLVSTDGGTNWTSVSNSNLSGTFSHIGAVTYEGDLYVLGNDKNLYKNPHTTDYTVTPIALTSNPTNFKFLGGKFVATCQSGYVWYSDDLINWHETEKIFDNLIKDITFGNDTYYIIGQGGEFAYSSDLTEWTQVIDTSFGSVATSVKYYDNKVLIGKNNGYITIFDIETQEKTELKVNPNESVNDIAILANNCILAISNYGTCYISYDHVTFTRLIDVGDIYLRRISLNKFVVGDSGIIIRLNQNVSWVPYPYIPIGEVIVNDGEVTYFTTYPYNTNGLFEATSSTFGLLRTAAPVDEKNCNCSDAVITPANLYNLQNFRLANTEYEVGHAVGCPYHHNLQLKCIIAGTTSNELLDTSGERHAGDQIQDGTVTWQIEELGTGGAGGGGLEIGDIGIATLGIDETQNKRRYINGQLIIQEQFVSFTNKVKKAKELYPGLFCTEEEWQATVTMSTYGQCGKFVIDDEAGTIRLPKITGFIQGLTDLASLGELVQAGLPTLTTDSTGAHTHTRGTMNITGSATGRGETNSFIGTDAIVSGAFVKGSTIAGVFSVSSGGDGVKFQLDASKGWTGATSSNGAHTHTIAGTADTVQPESIRYPYFIQVATGVEETIDTTREIELNNPFFFGYYQYFEIAPNNTSWLKSEAQWNNKEVYPDYYDWILTNANNGAANFKLSTDTYDDYSWVVNTADETFRLPIKTKNAPFTVSGAKTTLSMGALSIKGNGKALGITDGTNTLSWASDVSGTRHPACTDLGVNVGSKRNTSAGPILSNVALGISTDASKSGLTGSVSGTATTTVSTSENTNVSLYFYVGETTQNANLVNVGRIEESLAKKLDISTVRYDSSTSTLYIGVL